MAFNPILLIYRY